MKKEYIVIEHEIKGKKEIFAYCKNKNEILRAIDRAIEEGILEFQVKRKIVKWKNVLEETNDISSQQA